MKTAQDTLEQDDEDVFDDDPVETCPECGGTGTDRYNDHCLDCPKCDGEGTL